MDTIKQIIKQYLPVITVALLVMLVALVGLFAYNVMHTKKLQEPVILNQTTATNPQLLSKSLNVSPKTATEIIAKKQNTQPVATYYTQANSVHDAAVITQKAIKDNSPNLPKVATEKADRTAIVENTENQKVDVYKINLNKAHKIKAGATYLNDKAYFSVGYQAGRVETVAHFDTKEFKGATVMYTVKEW